MVVLVVVRNGLLVGAGGIERGVRRRGKLMMMVIVIVIVLVAEGRAYASDATAGVVLLVESARRQQVILLASARAVRAHQGVGRRCAGVKVVDHLMVMVVRVV